MRLQAIVAATVLAGAAVARAQQPTAAQLQAEGEQDAKDGNYAAAIDKFKAADRIEERASHACLIALAYTRRNLWPQAEIFRTECHERVSASDPLPEWMPVADKQIDAAIASANVAAVTIQVEPAEASAQAEVTVSSFAPDEKFPPRTIHLPPGIHQIFATAPGYAEGHQLIEIKDGDKTPRTIVIRLHRPEDVAGPSAVPAEPSATAHASGGTSRVPWILIGAGGTLAVAGGILHATVLRNAYNRLADAKDPTAYMNADNGDYERDRKIVLGLYGAAAVTIGIGVVLKYTVFKHHDEVPAVSFIPGQGGGLVTVGWTR